MSSRFVGSVGDVWTAMVKTPVDGKPFAELTTMVWPVRLIAEGGADVVVVDAGGGARGLSAVNVPLPFPMMSRNPNRLAVAVMSGTASSSEPFKRTSFR